MRDRTSRWRDGLALFVCAAVVSLAASAPLVHAEQTDVPPRLQVDLLARVIPYDRQTMARVGKPLRVLVLVKGGDNESKRIGAQLVGELRARDKLAQFTHDTLLATYAGAEDLVRQCAEQEVGIVYFSTGFSSVVPEIAKALREVRVLSVAAASGDVARGIVLGFTASSGKPKLLVNLAQARAQQVSFRADLLRIVKVVVP